MSILTVSEVRKSMVEAAEKVAARDIKSPAKRRLFLKVIRTCVNRNIRSVAERKR